MKLGASAVSLFLLASSALAQDVQDNESYSDLVTDQCSRDGLGCEVWGDLLDDARNGLSEGIKETQKILECQENPEACQSDTGGHTITFPDLMGP